MSSLLQRPRPVVSCTSSRTVRLFTGFKLLVLFFFAGALLAVALPALEPPSLVRPPPQILAGELALEGRGPAGVTVELFANGQPLGRSHVSGDGRWRGDVTLAAGNYELVIAAVARDGNLIVGEEGRATLGVVDVPTLELARGATTSSTADVIVSGRGTPLSRLRLLWNGHPIATFVVGDGGAWHYRQQVPIPSENVFVAEVLDRRGAPLAASPPQHLDLAAEPARAIQALAIEGAAFAKLSNDPHSGLVRGEATLTGSGEPGARVSLWYGGARAGVDAPISAAGFWQLQANLRMASGQQTVTVRMQSVTGEALGESDANLRVPFAPILKHSAGATDAEDLLLQGQAEPGEIVALQIDELIVASVEAGGDGFWQHAIRLGAGSHQIVARSANGLQSNQVIVQVALARPLIVDQRRDAQGRPLPGFHGRGRPHTQLDLVVAEDVVGQATVNGAGLWSCACTLPPGEHTVLVRETAEPQRVSDSLTITIENRQEPFVPGPGAPNAPPFRCPESSPPGVVEGDSYVVGCGESLSEIAFVLGVTVESMLAYNPQVSDPRLIYFGQRLNVATADGCADDLATP